jgi:hypothetical protein
MVNANEPYSQTSYLTDEQQNCRVEWYRDKITFAIHSYNHHEKKRTHR